MEQLDSKFDDMSTQILDRSECRASFEDIITEPLFYIVMQMSTRVDALEASIQDIINGENAGTPAPPSLPQSPVMQRKSGGV